MCYDAGGGPRWTDTDGSRFAKQEAFNKGSESGRQDVRDFFRPLLLEACAVLEKNNLAESMSPELLGWWKENKNKK